MISHTKEFGIYHWDTFDNETILIDEAMTLDEATNIVQAIYKGRIRGDGADIVEIVGKYGNIVAKFNVG